MCPTALATLGLAVLVASAVPFVPTGEIVSGAAALAGGSVPAALTLYVVVLVASVLGDGVMYVAATVAADRLPARARAWLAARRSAPAVRRARRDISGRAYRSLLVGRLVPGARAPVIIALGAGRCAPGTFVAADVLACAVWAGLYVTIGAVGARVTGHPVAGTALAVACAVTLGLTVQGVRRRVSRGRTP
ncbi:VTT domain-containing protein [Cellulomonas sp. ATA003]|uniref:DedA family protein n=1 Tax=Cellulomonas sp. ATA003 TaxID=3073064 RepID=UPI0028733CD9|nr:VTT domain-containing protein [Cellulomonas sp. ATA003]WNB84560.1 VTT domain-containing protein [Cellulomonas sp. ATA003]